MKAAARFAMKTQAHFAMNTDLIMIIIRHDLGVVKNLALNAAYPGHDHPQAHMDAPYTLGLGQDRGQAPDGCPVQMQIRVSVRVRPRPSMDAPYQRRVELFSTTSAPH